MTTRVGVTIATLLALPCVGLAQNNEARKSLNAFLSGIGEAQRARREQAVTAIRTRPEAERRQAEVRAKILDLMGGLPERRGQVRVKDFGALQEDGFRIEKIAYESLPDFWVTANVYVPAATGRFPAVILAPGHGPGKESQASWAANLARNGVVALAIDVLGAGERLKHYDPELEASKVEPSGEHEHASLSTLLIGCYCCDSGYCRLLVDVGDLLRAITPRPVVLVNPADAMGLATRAGVTSVRMVRRGFRDPLPIE